jgi:hypothetical protein
MKRENVNTRQDSNGRVRPSLQEELAMATHSKVTFALGEEFVKRFFMKPIRFAASWGPNRDFRRDCALALQWLTEECELQREMNERSQTCH